MRLIDADALICPIFEGLPEDDFVKGYREGKADAVIDIRTFAPTIDPEELRPKGHWIKRGNEKKCSVCGFIYYSNNDEWNGCPNCLSVMDEKRRDSR